METLLEDYKRKLNNVKELIEKQRSNGSIVHQRREERLNTKAAEYRAFIVDIERAMARQQQQGSANCAIFDVSVSLPNEIDLGALANLLKYSNKYEISIQFWPEQIAVYIEKDGVDLKDFGGDFDFAVSNSIAYLDRITGQ